MQEYSFCTGVKEGCYPFCHAVSLDFYGDPESSMVKGVYFNASKGECLLWELSMCKLCSIGGSSCPIRVIHDVLHCRPLTRGGNQKA